MFFLVDISPEEDVICLYRAGISEVAADGADAGVIDICNLAPTCPKLHN